MKTFQYICAGIVLALLVAGIVVMDGMSGKKEREVRCTAFNIEMVGPDYGLITEADVRKIANRTCGNCVGQLLDSLNLAEIERSLDFRGEVKSSNAYTTGDGVLHLRVERRVPVVKFITVEGIRLYADGDGYLFPALKDSKRSLPCIEGSIPLQEGDNSGNEWLRGVVALFSHINKDKTWRGGFSKVTTDSKGNLTLWPVVGSECFIIGQPRMLESKFARMEDYYKSIAPTGNYSTVNLSYAGQIVCKNKNQQDI